MQITRQADYALRAVIYLSRLGADERAATSQIAQEQRIPPSFLAKIVSQLSVAGLLQTSRGARGGVSLAKAPDRKSVV
jgi:Rrf2 family protein